jgi:hypothetical protein
LRFIKLLLAVSVAETGNVLPKTEGKRSFLQFMTAIMDTITTKIDEFTNPNDLILAVEKLRKIRESIAETAVNNRSNWLTLIDDDFPQAERAKQLIHLGYNYTLEDSVLGASKHYDDEDFENSFARDLICRIERLECVKHEAISLKKWRSCWKKAERISRLDGVSAKTVTALYEKDYLKERSRWRRRALRKTATSLLFSLAYALLFVATEHISSLIETPFSAFFGSHGLLPFFTAFISIIIIGLFSAVIERLLKLFNKNIEIPDILECFISIFVHITDFFVITGGKYDSYRTL